jgi:acyl carrier protein
MHDDRISCLLKRVFDLSDSDLSRDLKREEIWEWDSLRHLVLITSLEKELHIRLSIEDIQRMESLNAIRVVVAEKMSHNE